MQLRWSCKLIGFRDGIAIFSLLCIHGSFQSGSAISATLRVRRAPDLGFAAERARVAISLDIFDLFLPASELMLQWIGMPGRPFQVQQSGFRFLASQFDSGFCRLRVRGGGLRLTVFRSGEFSIADGPAWIIFSFASDSHVCRCVL